MNQIQLGPLNIPVSLLTALFALLSGSLTVIVIFKSNRQIRSRFFDTLSSALVVVLVTWKLFPLFYNIKLVKNPLALLYAPGGLPGIVTGIVLGLGFYGFKAAKTEKNSRKTFLIILLTFTASSIVSGLFFSTAYSSLNPKETQKHAYIFSAEDADGEKVTLNDFKGKTVILNFWATWCPPCRGELPLLTSFAENLPAGTVLLGVNATSSEKSIETVKAFAENKEINFPVLFDSDGKIAAAYSIKTLPTTIIISNEGNITRRKTGAVDHYWLRSQLPE
ncbi:MAG: hypothetical protein DRP59_09350 [Spirochaetes bacterium]|nr:MAG: hypothetical protein DRP59_09350 [Spirochaetota bacterium]